LVLRYEEDKVAVINDVLMILNFINELHLRNLIQFYLSLGVTMSRQGPKLNSPEEMIAFDVI
jgi:hypothetical protein